LYAKGPFPAKTRQNEYASRKTRGGERDGGEKKEKRKNRVSKEQEGKRSE
jgi:hypothetical protein